MTKINEEDRRPNDQYDPFDWVISNTSDFVPVPKNAAYVSSRSKRELHNAPENNSSKELNKAPKKKMVLLKDTNDNFQQHMWNSEDTIDYIPNPSMSMSRPSDLELEISKDSIKPYNPSKFNRRGKLIKLFSSKIIKSGFQYLKDMAALLGTLITIYLFIKGWF